MKIRALLCAAVGLATMVIHVPSAHAVKGYYSAQKETSDVTAAEFPAGFSPYVDPDFEEPWGIVVTHNPCYLFPTLACYANAPPLLAIPAGTSAPDAAIIVNFQMETRKVVWTADRDSGVVNLYDDQGAPVKSGGNDITILMPTPPAGVAFNPVCEPSTIASASGVAYSTACSTAQPVSGTFNITANGKTAPAFLLITGRNGKIYGWNPVVDPTYPVVLRDDSALGSDYTGITVDPWGSKMYLADYRKGHIAAYDDQIHQVPFVVNNQTVPYLTDSQMPAGFVPTNVAMINGHLYATFGKQSPLGSEEEVVGPPANSPVYNGVFGYADDFVINANGTFQVTRLNVPSDKLNAPWGIVYSPINFGPYSQMLYIGNFGDGYINAFDIATDTYVGRLGESLTGDPVPSNPIWIPGLRGLGFKPMLYQGPSNTIPMKFWWAPRLFYGATLNFTSPNNQEWSVFGYIKPN